MHIIGKIRILNIAKHLLFLCFTAVCCGALGALFSFALSRATAIRLENGWLILLMPLVGCLVVAVGRWLHTEKEGTDRVLLFCSGNGDAVSPLLTPSIFAASFFSHLVGASVGREGAALQLGGATAMAFGRLFKLTLQQQRLLCCCGMAGVFSAVFGTPLAAAAFVLEMVSVGRYRWKLSVPLLATSILSYTTARLLGAHAERFSLVDIPPFRFGTIGGVLLIAVVAALLSIVFCVSLRQGKRQLSQVLPNAFVRIIVGGVALVVLTIAVGSQRYNGAGVDVIETVFDHGMVQPWDFALKLLFTVVAVSSGYKGGEIVPSLFIGATFGGFAATLLGLPTAFGAAIGLTVLFCGATNCVMASALLAAELFSFRGIPYVLLAALVGFFLSGGTSLYPSQKDNKWERLF